jgi:hypothetical protein
MTSVNTANKVLTTLAAIFKLAQRYGPIKGKANVAELVKRLKVSNEENESEDEEVRPEEVYTGEELHWRAKPRINRPIPNLDHRL